MIDEEKQPENTSQATTETEENQNPNGNEGTATSGELTDLESLPDEEVQTAETLRETATSVSSVDDELGSPSSPQPYDAVLGADASSTDEGALQELRQENEALKAQLEELNQQLDGLKTQSMRMAADFDNFRKRTSKEKEDLEQQIKRVTLSELLPVVDNFERARSHIKPQTDGEMGIHKSYQGVYKQLVDCLNRIGVSAMRPEGQEFDPNLHEAVLREPTNEYPEGVVIEQLQRGYFLGDKVLRHAMVKVAAAPEISSEDASETPSTSSD
jgi:molecular chaperone GrpE